MDDLSRRVKCLRIGDTFLPVIFGKNVAPYRISHSPLPDDARVVRCEMEFGWSFKLLIQSAEFDPIPDGGRIPEIMPVLTRLDDPGIGSRTSSRCEFERDHKSVEMALQAEAARKVIEPPVKFREFT